MKKLKVKRVYTDSDEMLILDFGDGITLEASRVWEGQIEVKLNTKTFHRIVVKPLNDKAVLVSVEEP